MSFASFTVGLPVSRSSGEEVSRADRSAMIGPSRLAGWPVGWLVAWLAGWLVDWPLTAMCPSFDVLLPARTARRVLRPRGSVGTGNEQGRDTADEVEGGGCADHGRAHHEQPPQGASTAVP